MAMNFSDLLPALDAAVAEHLGDAAMWSGHANPVRILLSESDEPLEWGGSSSIVERIIIEVRVLDVATPNPGDTVQLGPRVFRILRDHPRKRADGTWWICPAEEISL